MAMTNFAGLTSKEKTVWSRSLWKDARDKQFINKFSGTSDGSMIQKITELTKTEKGEKALMFLVADLVKDGVIGDNEREGNEEALQSYEQEITIDLISHGNKNKGKLSDQKHVIKFREQSKNKLSYWLANRMDQLAFLTMSGVGYDKMCNGAPRDASSPFPDLAFAGQVAAPTANRHVYFDGTSLQAGDTSAITTACVPKYGMIIDAVAYAKDTYLKPLMAGGKEYYVLLVKPGTLAALKKDADYLRAVTTALPRSAKNPWFTGATITIDGVVIHEHNLVYNTKGASAPDKWGGSGDVDGTRSLLCGAQALGMTDLGPPEWAEKGFDYDSKQGINIDKMFGLLKPKFYNTHHGSIEDFGVMAIDTYLA